MSSKLVYRISSSLTSKFARICPESSLDYLLLKETFGLKESVVFLSEFYVF